MAGVLLKEDGRSVNFSELRAWWGAAQSIFLIGCTIMSPRKTSTPSPTLYRLGFQPQPLYCFFAPVRYVCLFLAITLFKSVVLNQYS
jgi:hypothetical protein